MEYIETDPVKENLKPKMESTTDFFERIEREMSFIYRYERIPQGCKFELANFNAKVEPVVDILERLVEPLEDGQKFSVLVVRQSYLLAPQLERLNELISSRSSRDLWRVHMHRSTIGSDAESMMQLLKFFELIGQKPIVDLKMDSLTNIQCIDELAQAFTSNTAIRNKSRVGKLSMLMYVHQKLKERH